MKESSWILLALSTGIRPTLNAIFVAVAGIVQGRKWGRWPTLVEWCSALVTVSRGLPHDRRDRCEATQGRPGRHGRGA